MRSKRRRRRLGADRPDRCRRAAGRPGTTHARTVPRRANLTLALQRVVVVVSSDPPRMHAFARPCQLMRLVLALHHALPLHSLMVMHRRRTTYPFMISRPSSPPPPAPLVDHRIGPGGDMLATTNKERPVRGRPDHTSALAASWTTSLRPPRTHAGPWRGEGCHGTDAVTAQQRAAHKLGAVYYCSWRMRSVAVSDQAKCARRCPEQNVRTNASISLYLACLLACWTCTARWSTLPNHCTSVSDDERRSIRRDQGDAIFLYDQGDRHV